MSEAQFLFQCPQCQARSEVPTSWQGKRRPCPACHEWVAVPGAATAPAAAEQSPEAGGDGPLSFAERMKLAAERGSTAVRQKEVERARRQAARAQAPTFEEKMRKATGAANRPAAGAVGADANAAVAPVASVASVADSLSPADLPPLKPALVGGAAVADDPAEEARRAEREARLAQAAYAPEKIGRMSVILCAIALAVFLLSMAVVCAGGFWAVTGAARGAQPSFLSGAMMSFGVCMFGFSPLCALCGFLLGVHSLLRSRNTKLWGALGVVLNGLLVVPPIIMIIVIMAGR